MVDVDTALGAGVKKRKKKKKERAVCRLSNQHEATRAPPAPQISAPSSMDGGNRGGWGRKRGGNASRGSVTEQ